ncbi:MAG: hypothetical protein ABIS03_07925, partial [Gemmatimonadaceae bacterium]
PFKTPLAEDVDFRTLAERYEVSGGDIKNAVLKAATMAAAAIDAEGGRMIHQRHFERAMSDVVTGRAVMQQSLFGDAEPTADDKLMRAIEAAEVRWQKSAQVAIGVGGAGIVLALIAVVVALVR